MTTPTTPVRLPGDPIPPPPEPRYPWRVAVTMLGLVVLVLVVVWLGFQAVRGPATSGQFPTAPTATAYARAFQATVSAVDTAEPRPTSAATPQPTVVPAAAPTSAPVAVSAPVAAPAATPQVAPTVPAQALVQSAATAASAATSAPTPAPAQTPAGTSGGPASAATPWPTVAPELTAEVSQAYLHYWQVVADTALSLDPAPLDEVAAGDQLRTLQNNLEEDRANNQATRMKVEHDFVVLSANSDQAEVADKLTDSSVLVDASTHDPLAGQTAPAQSGSPPTVNAILDLQRIDGIWKVVRAAKAVEQTP